MSARIALVEDHGLISHTVSAALRAKGMEVVEVFPTAQGDLLDQVLGTRADLVLLDLDLGPAGDADPLVAPLAATGMRVVVVTGTPDRMRHARCVRAGAVGVVSKAAAFEYLAARVEHALNGGVLLDRSEREDMLADLRRHEAVEGARLAPFAHLTQREQVVLGLLMKGRSVADIAGDAVVSVSTVRTQVRAILQKLDAPSQVVAIAKAHDAGWVPPREH